MLPHVEMPTYEVLTNRGDSANLNCGAFMLSNGRRAHVCSSH